MSCQLPAGKGSNSLSQGTQERKAFRFSEPLFHRCEELSSELMHHEELFTGTTLEMGKIQWYFLKADTESENKFQTEKEHKPETKEFDKDVYCNPIHWWAFKKETDIKELLKRSGV